MGIFSRGSRGSGNGESGKRVVTDPFVALADTLSGVRPWMKPEVKPAQEGRSILTFRTRPLGGWIVTNDSHGWTGLKADIGADGHFLPMLDASPVFLRPNGARMPELTAILMALCGADLAGYAQAHAQGADPEAARNAMWAEAELESLRSEGWV